jgi:hypothetical protein
VSILIYKQRHRPPNKATTPRRNADYIEYIATRPGVWKNKESDHGLFGRLSAAEDEGVIKDWQTAAEKVRQESEKKTTIYNSIVAFKRETAGSKGLARKEDWERFAAEHIRTMAAHNGIDIQNLAYVAAVHCNKPKYPHLHITFWDTNQQVGKSWVDPKVPNAIRKQVIRDTFTEELAELHERSGELKKELRSDAAITELEKYVAVTKPHEQSEFEEIYGSYEKDWLRKHRKMGAVGEETIGAIKSTLREIYALKENLPAKGSLKYKLLPPEIKDKVDKITQELLRSCPEYKKTVDEYVKVRREETVMFSSNKEYVEKQEARFRAEAEKIVSNRILQVVKQISTKKAFEDEAAAYYAEELAIGILGLLGRLARSKQTRLDDRMADAMFGGELSAQAKRELAIKMADEGLER